MPGFGAVLKTLKVAKTPFEQTGYEAYGIKGSNYDRDSKQLLTKLKAFTVEGSRARKIIMTYDMAYGSGFEAWRQTLQNHTRNTPSEQLQLESAAGVHSPQRG